MHACQSTSSGPQNAVILDFVKSTDGTDSKMPKGRPKKSSRVRDAIAYTKRLRLRNKSSCVKDAIAYRTRLRLGSVMHRTKPVQHPHCWPLLRELENNKERRCKSVCPCKTASGSRRNKGNKSKLRSVIQLITFTRNKRRKRRQIRNHGQSNRRSKSKYNRIKRSGSQRRRKMSPKNIYRQSRYRRNKSHRRANRYSKRRRRRARGRTSQKATTKRKRTPAHQKDPRSGQGDDSDKRTPRRKLTSDFSLRRENDNMFGPQPSIISENLDKGLDEIKDDPLRMSQVCRAMVSNLPGVPDSKQHTQTVNTHQRHNMMAIISSKQTSKNIKNKHENSKIRKRIRRKMLSRKLNRNKRVTRTSVKVMSRRTTKVARKQARSSIRKMNPRKRTTVSVDTARNNLAARKSAHKREVVRSKIRRSNKRNTNGHEHHRNRRTADSVRLHRHYSSGAKRRAGVGKKRHGQF